MNWFQIKNVRVLERPGNLPDLHPIENLWTLIKKKVSTSNSTTMDERKRIIKEVWCKDIDHNVCKNFTKFHSYPHSKGYYKQRLPH